ncbi:molybdopterin-dependent oxidoreductase [Nocardia tenerifensis]|uniref:molybdopterin-dependent oxidoreductase n=1 Tax=Nocardia tenerifensis TaxID=228006 RepID=UPI0011B83848|nr:molybdopterin-dependent oxidoreductase [Nocardia tenerifensis]
MLTNGDRGRGVGAAAVGAAALGVGEAIAATRGGSLIDTLGRAVIDVVPVPIVETTVAMSGKHDKIVTRLGIGAGAVAATVGLAALPDRVRTAVTAASGVGAAALATRLPSRSTTTVAGAVAAAGVLATGLRRRPHGLLGTLAWAATGAGMFAAAHTLQHDLDRKHDNDIRRIGPMGALGVVPRDGLEDEPGLSPLVTAARRMYVADVTLRPPRIDPAHWRLSVTGKVAHPLRLSLAELAEDAVEFDAVMVCVHNQPGEGRAANGRWYGVPLADLLKHAIPESDATRLVTRAVDGYTISLPVEPLRSGEWPGYVVIGMNGEPLTPAHGFPARVFVPGLYGQYTGAKWLGQLELTDDTHVDYWWRRGWPAGPLWVTPQARIDVIVPGRGDAGERGGAEAAASSRDDVALSRGGGVAVPGRGGARTFTVAGVAWAPPHGVAGVEVRVDEGDWRPVDLSTELAPAAWRRWRLAVELAPGEHQVQARAISRSGEVQEGRHRPSFPTGPSGFHTRTVHA